MITVAITALVSSAIGFAAAWVFLRAAFAHSLGSHDVTRNSAERRIRDLVSRY